jgi:transposase
MAYNFHPMDRKQKYLLPPSLEDWLGEGHLVWMVLEAVEQMDLAGFYRSYREDGCGNTAYHPRMMLALLLYGYCHGEPSSRQLERLCQTDIAYRAITVSQFPDHSTIARFRQKHRQALRSLFLEVLKLCAQAGLGKLGIVALDGTKMKANASLSASRTEKYLQQEIERMLKEADAKDQEEDKLYGKDRRGDELPKALRSREKRQARLKACQEQLDREKELADNERLAKQQERQAREEEADQSLRGRKPKPEESDSERKVNLTDPDSRILKTQNGYVQGHNAQAVVSADQIILAAEIVEQANDQGLLHPMVQQAQMNVEDAGFSDTIVNVTADAGYGNENDLRKVPAGSPKLYVATQKSWKQRKQQQESPSPRGRIPACLTAMERMTRKLLTQAGRKIYKIRGQTVEPVFGQIKQGLGLRAFSGRGLEMCEGEWFLICAAHNLRKLFHSGKACFGN